MRDDNTAGPASLRRDNERGRVVADGRRAGDGQRRSLMVVREASQRAGGERRSGSGVAGEEELEALRASVRCGRRLPLMHLTELRETISQRHCHQDPMVLCATENLPDLDPCDPDPYDPDGDCPGCRDCLRYCAECAREAARFSAGTGSSIPPSA
ncbi:MAG: hypothetical protein ACRDRG_12885 [Pseudonocardiaceae bacterium]